MEGHNKHFSHAHNLNLHHLREGTEITCFGCKSSGIATVYACFQCNFFLHEQCFRATRSLQHPSHPSHPLTLFPFPTYPSNSFNCNSCTQVGTGFTYACSDCEFDLHVQCAYGTLISSHLTPLTDATPVPNYHMLTQTGPSYNAAQYSPVSQPFHNSQLIPSDHIQNYPPLNETVHNLNTSQSPYSPIKETMQKFDYGQNFPHQSGHNPRTQFNNPMPSYPPINESLPSLKAPQSFQTSHAQSSNDTTGVSNTKALSKPGRVKTEKLMHFSHPHSLLLVNPKAGEESTECTCSACEEIISGSRYFCFKSGCDFHLDNSCFMLPQTIQHKCHPEHPLILLSSASDQYSQFTCNACYKDGSGFTYQCTTCEFDLHIGCAFLPETVKRDDHIHPLKLLYSCPVYEEGYAFYCDVCGEIAKEDWWTYYCEECDNGTHVDCVNCEVTASTETGNNESETSTGNPLLDAQLQMQRLQLRMQISRQTAQMMMSMGQNACSLTR